MIMHIFVIQIHDDLQGMSVGNCYTETYSRVHYTIKIVLATCCIELLVNDLMIMQT